MEHYKVKIDGREINFETLGEVIRYPDIGRAQYIFMYIGQFRIGFIKPQMISLFNERPDLL
jgi:hypothetical protein